MNQSFRTAAISAVVLLMSALPALAGPPIKVLAEKGGKLVLIVDDETVRTEVGGKPVLFIDGPKISKEKDGKLLFFIDGDILHAYVPEGPVVGYKDGRQLRTAPGGKETIYIDGPIVRKPNLKGDPILWIDDHAVLNNQQLFAALYILKPEIFDMPKEPPASGDATAATAAPAAPTPTPAATPAASNKPFTGGTYSIASYKSSDGTKHTGKITIAKQGDIFAIDVKFGEGDAQQGIGFVKDGVPELWAAFGPPNTVGLAVYEVTGGTLNGVWYNLGGDAHKFGLENLVGAADIGGAYNITSAKAPFTGAMYTGKVTIDPVTKTMLGGDAQTYNFAWDLGGYKAQGVGFKSGADLIAATSAGSDYSAIRFKIDPATGDLTGDFYTLGKVTGSYSLKRDGD